MRKAIVVFVLAAWSNAMAASEFFVSPSGDDANPGTLQRPFATLARAQRAARAAPRPVMVYVRGGIYYLDRTLVFTAADSGKPDAAVTYRAYENERAVISGAFPLKLHWTDHQGGIKKAKVPPGTRTDQLFVNGLLQPLARYPNYDPHAAVFNGYARDCIARERVARWKDPTGGFIHALHRARWGGMHYRITGKKPDGSLAYEGGWQNNRPSGMHPTFRFVENIFEELDAPGEWFLDEKTDTLYYYPPAGLDLARAKVEGVRLRHLVEFRGSTEAPVHHLVLRGLAFRGAARTFMETREPLLRSDWCIYRGGAVLFAGAEDCSIQDCLFDQLGGNAVFVSNYNRRVAVRGCHFRELGASAICFVGDPKAVRGLAQNYRQGHSYATIDKTPGPRTDNYPADCLVEDCLIHRIGRIEKQTAGVEISMSRRIAVRHCSIYETPRAGINIGDGCWGGHLIEFCDVFDTVLETGDHGSFNSWGRDRFWHLRGVDLNSVTLGPLKNLPLLDALEPITIRNSRWRCDHGWDIDLDDGSSNYRIYNNLCLNGGIKHREGFYRVCENNIMVNNSFHPHVWFRNSQDVFRRNIVFSRYRPVRVAKPWGKTCDYNLLHSPGQRDPVPATELRAQSGRDEHSLKADARFVNPAAGDYRVANDSPALELGFKNFPMDRFGVQRPALRAIARTPRLPLPGRAKASQPTSKAILWLGARVKKMETEGEKSATGMFDILGVLFLDVPPDSVAARLGFRTLDVLYELGGRKVNSTGDLRAATDALRGRRTRAKVFRHQNETVLDILVPKRP